MNASHGGNATHARIAAPNIAVLLRGGSCARRPPSLPRRYARPVISYGVGYTVCAHARRDVPLANTPTARTPCPRLARRWPIRPTATASPSGARSLPCTGVSKAPSRWLATTTSGCATWPRSLLTTATPHDAQTLSRLRMVPGSGELLRLGRRDASQDLQRFSRMHDRVSDGRLVIGAQASAGKRDGPSGSKRGNASLPRAFSAAAVRFGRAKPAGQKSLTRWEHTHGQGKAWPVLAHHVARAAYDL